MQARIGIVFKNNQQFFAERRSSCRRELGRSKFAKQEHQGAANGDVVFVVEALVDQSRVAPQWTEPMDDVATNSRVGSKLENRPHVLRAAQPHQSDGDVGLPGCPMLLLLVGRFFRQPGGELLVSE